MKTCSECTSRSLAARQSYGSTMVQPFAATIHCTFKQLKVVQRRYADNNLEAHYAEYRRRACLHMPYHISPCSECSTEYRIYTLCRSFDLWNHAENCRELYSWEHVPVGQLGGPGRPSQCVGPEPPRTYRLYLDILEVATHVHIVFAILSK
jgi:hypothetical protein